MNKLTYENYGDYYIFSNNPDTRVYLGSASPEDYIHDVEELQKRRESCGYYKISTGEPVDDEEVENSDEDVYFGDDFLKEEDFVYGYKCDYENKNKLSLGAYSGKDRSCYYNAKDSHAKLLARAYYFNQTIEQVELLDKQFKAEWEEKEKKNPSLANLMWTDGKMYYVDDDGLKITSEEHVAKMKDKYGEDVFEKEKERLDKETSPEVKEIVNKILNRG